MTDRPNAPRDGIAVYVAVCIALVCIIGYLFLAGVAIDALLGDPGEACCSEVSQP